jgi:hypothetical protein
MDEEPHNMVRAPGAVFDPGFLGYKKSHIGRPAAGSEGRRGVGFVQVGCYRKNQGNQIFFGEFIAREYFVIESPDLDSHITGFIFALNRSAHRYKMFFRH